MDISLKDMDKDIFESLVFRVQNIDKRIGKTKVFHGWNNNCLESALLGNVLNLFIVAENEDKEYLNRIKDIVTLYDNDFYTAELRHPSYVKDFKENGKCYGECLTTLTKGTYHYNDLMRQYGMTAREEFYSFGVIRTMHRIYKDTKNEEYRNSEKVMFHCLLFLSLYENCYEKNLERISTLAKDLDFTKEQIEDFCLAVNTFIQGKEIFGLPYKSQRAREVFCK